MIPDVEDQSLIAPASEAHPPNPASTSNVTSTPASQKGHVLKLVEEGGVFCMKCGKSTKNFKHQRLKILNKPCQKAELPQHLRVDKPGDMNNPNRLNDA